MCYTVVWSIAGDATSSAWSSEVFLKPVDSIATPVATGDGQGSFPPTDIAVNDLALKSATIGSYFFDIEVSIKDVIQTTAAASNTAVSLYINIVAAPSSCPSAPYTVSINEASTLSSSSPYYVMIGSSVDLNGSSPLSVTVLDSDGVFPVTDSSCYTLAWSKGGSSG